MKSRSSWIKTMAVNALSSPRATFRKANSSRSSFASPSIPLSMLLTLTRVVEFLDDNYNEEEGLYSKSGLGLERKELLRCCQSQQLPDLSLYNPHSIASVLKEILSELYEPLIPADIGQKLVDAASGGRIDEEAEKMVTEIFKQIRFSTREFLQVFLGHLNHLSTSGSSKMSVTNLALHVGIALVRPTEDKAALSSKSTIRRRKCVAEFLIRQASALPYDCATEMDIPALPELESAPTDPKSTLKQLHFVQVTWTIGEASFTPERLKEIFGKFGEIENLGINDQGNRAIVAYVDPQAAEAAEHASIASVRVRRRKPRLGEKRLEYSSHSPEHHSSRHDDATDFSEAVTMLSTNESAPIPSLLKPEQDLPTSRAADAHPETSETKYNRTDDTMVVEDIEDDQDNYTSDRLNSFPHRESKEEDSDLLQTDAVGQNGEIEKEDPAGSAVASIDTVNQELDNRFPTEELQVDAIKEPTEPEDPPSEILAGQSSTIVQIKAELDSIDTQRTDNALRESNENTLPEEESTHFNEDPDGNESANNIVGGIETTLKVESSHSVNGEPRDLQSLHPTATSAETVASTDCDLVGNSAPNDVLIEELQHRLCDMEKILSTSAAALSASKFSNEFERAVFQLHKQILNMVGDCMVLTGAKHGQVSDKLMAGTNAEFLDFLEAQSRTQVKILEVEVRAGQELLRLHKTQYEKERIELEEEITTLRVGRTETERLCAELRSDLRKCRSELACHVANATDIQRQKSLIEEKLVDSENKLYAKDVALVKLQAEYDKMHRVAAEAQMRVEKFKHNEFDGDSKSRNNQLGHAGSEDFPHTSKLLSRLSKQSMDKGVGNNPSPSAEVEFSTSKIPSRASNVAALEVMKHQMARDIQEQIATTRAALREMEICGSSGKTLEEEEEELRELQRQLAVKSSEIDTAMDESRTKLKELLDSATEGTVSNQEPTIFDSTALVNELISRVEKPSARSFTKDTSPFNLGEQTSFSSIGSEQLAPYHRPTHEAQSFLYRTWTADRARKMTQLASYRDQQAVVRAQQSMQAFQQALAEAREQR